MAAACLGCGANAGRVIYSRVAVVTREEPDATVITRVCRRIVHCTKCGQHRAQTIEDEGVTRRRKVPPER